ncbi:MAG TPA: hypothetical protein VM661_15115 [Candidatus Sulfotelmatobacter sp.]|jgi:hypothetical protein|nr:hypothetical protein [Candidatus Sulfotelmatobacter sp.]
MNFKSLLIAAALLIPAAAANATVVSTGATVETSNLQGSVSFTSGINDTSKKVSGVNAYSLNQTFSDTVLSPEVSFSKSNTGVSFTSTYLFTLTNYSTNVSLALSQIGSNISNLTYTLYKLVDGILTPVKIKSTTTSTVGSSTISSTSYANLLANTTYELVVTGVAKGGVYSSYSGSISLNPVPLPAALPLFGTALVGFGLFGRRRNKKAAAAA